MTYRRLCWMPFAWLAIRYDWSMHLFWVSIGYRAQTQFGLLRCVAFELICSPRSWRIQLGWFFVTRCA